MKIALNLLYLLPGLVGGTETYAVSLLRELAAIDGENEYVVFVNRESAELELPSAPNLRRVVCPVDAARRPLRYAWEQLVLPFQLRRHRVDLVHSLGYVGPLFSPCPSVVTIHDLNFVAVRDTMSRGKRLVLRFFSSWSARLASQVITDSAFSSLQIQQLLGISSDRVAAVHLGPGQFTDGHGPAQSDSGGNRYQIHSPYLCAFAGTYVHKNVTRLLSAFERLSRELPHSLVLIGRLPQEVDLSRHAALVSEGRIRHLGHLPAADVASVLGGAALFVFPSLYEGFGLPVLEAQQLGVPVACSSAASLPEVAGQGAVFFDPTSVDDMAATIRRCLLDPELRRELVQNGYSNVARFSWEGAARETLRIYQRVVAENRHARVASAPAGRPGGNQ